MEYSGSDATRVYFEIEHKRDSIARIINTLNEHYKVLSNASGNDSAMHVVINQIKAQEKTRKELVKQMLSKTPSSLACLFYLNDYNIDNDSLFLERVDSALMATHPENIFVKSNHTTFQTKKTIRVGKMAPDIVLLTPEGETAKLSDFRGKIVLVDFWASWCGPCRRENPNLVRIYKEYQPKGFEIFGVSTDRDRNGWLKAIKDDNITWTQVHDEKSQYGAQWGAFSIPYTILIDREGKILEIGLRGHQLENRLKNLLKK
ncbi:MAG: TlpA disulfide reductase family protein [Bacteroidales bacterium]|nr:TlpA disulfide reductase family protein [Bacteroidales bacterium]